MQTAIQSFKDLKAWQEAHGLVLTIYGLTKKFPPEEAFNLTNQLRRAAVSISSNIAEGFSRRYPREKSQFYRTALGSLTEIQNQILIGKDVGYIDEKLFIIASDQTVRVSKLINGLLKSMKSLTPVPLPPA